LKWLQSRNVGKSVDNANNRPGTKDAKNVDFFFDFSCIYLAFGRRVGAARIVFQLQNFAISGFGVNLGNVAEFLTQYWKGFKAAAEETENFE
jgi:hypothetical protein